MRHAAKKVEPPVRVLRQANMAARAKRRPSTRYDLIICAARLRAGAKIPTPSKRFCLTCTTLCRYQSSTKEIYIDCFRKGMFLNKGDCIKYLLQTNFGLAEGHLSPVSSRRILLRMCNNLVNTYGHLEQTDEAARVQRYIAALTR